jgi:FkbH-like protein
MSQAAIPLRDAPLDERDVIREEIASPPTFSRGYERLKARLRRSRSVKDFHFAYSLLKTFAGDPARQPFMHSVKVALLASSTVDHMPPLLETDLMLEDVRAQIYKPHHNQFRQEVFDPQSGLYDFRPDVAVLAFDLETLFPDLAARFPELTPAERDGFADDALAMVSSLVDGYRRSLRGHPSVMLIQDWVAPFQSYAPLVAGEDAWPTFIARLNDRLAELCAQTPDTYVCRYSQLVADRGRTRWTDPRLYYTAGIAAAQENWLAVTDLYVRHLNALLGRNVKCLVLDLDNTLWGGVLGEDGPEGIHVGPTYPGSAFRRFQEHLLSLSAAGYILAISSKNDPDDVRAVLRGHKWMVLREPHFAAIEANWQDKAASIAAISREIHISVDHMLFIDDNAVEIEKVKAVHPQIRCLQIESPPLRFAEQLASLRCLGKLAVTDQDRQRTRQYLGDRQRRELLATVPSVDDFLKGLEQRATVYVNHAPHRARIAELTQRTNQFNMTTLRLTESEVDERLRRPDCRVLTVELADRFGDQGIVACIQVRRGEATWVLENFLMSCRVLGRSLEQSLVDYVIEKARAEGVETVLAGYAATKKNAPFADFYVKNGFAETDPEPHDVSCEKLFLRRVAEHRPPPRLLEIIDHGA